MNVKKVKLVQEVERKFLVKVLPKNLRSYSYKELIAGYFKDKDGEDVRIRKEGREYFKVQKTGSGLARDIGLGDIKITQKEFKMLWPKTKGRRLWKRRYYILYGELVLELDLYHDFKDFYTVEVEFKNIKKAKKFKPLKWFGRELTDDNRYSSNSLASRGMPRE